MMLSEITFEHSLSVQDYNALRLSAGWNPINEAQAQRGLHNAFYLISAVHNGQRIGMARAVSDGGYVVIIVDVIVHPVYQRMGIGKAMMGRMMDHIRGSLAEGEGVCVNLMAAKGKEAFYRSFGFTERPNDQLGAGMTQWIGKG